MKEYRIILDFENNTLESELDKAVQHDYNTIKLVFEISETYDTALFKLNRPNSDLVLEIIDNELILEKGILSENGIYRYEVTLYKDDEKKTNFATGSFVVRSTVVDTDEILECDDRIPILDELFDKVKEIADVDTSAFITRAVDDLENYYKTSETYSQSEINELLGQLQRVTIEVSEYLPETPKTNVIYFIPKENSEQINYYDEFIYIGDKWECIGNTRIDLTDYATKDYVDNSVDNLNIGRYATKDYVDSTVENIDLSDYAEKTYVDNRISEIPEPEEYELPIASETTLGGVKIGDNLEIDENGVLSASSEGMPTYFFEANQLTTPENKQKLEEIDIHINNGTKVKIFVKSLSSIYESVFYEERVQTGQHWRNIDFALAEGNTISSKKTRTLYFYRLKFNMISAGTLSSGITPTFSHIESYYLPTDEVLVKGRTEAFTPTLDYEPTTKKYVDNAIDNIEIPTPELPIASDEVLGGIKVGENLAIDENGILSANISGEGIPVYYVNNSNNAENKTILSNICRDLYNDKNCIIRFGNQSEFKELTNINFYKNDKRLILYFKIQSNSSINKITDNSTGNIAYRYDAINVYFNDNFEITSFNHYCENDTVLLTNKSKTALMKDNTTSYNVTSDYNPAHKKYVDDKPKTYTGYDSTKTQILKNINGTLTWEEEISEEEQESINLLQQLTTIESEISLLSQLTTVEEEE